MALNYRVDEKYATASIHYVSIMLTYLETRFMNSIFDPPRNNLAKKEPISLTHGLGRMPIIITANYALKND